MDLEIILNGTIHTADWGLQLLHFGFDIVVHLVCYPDPPVNASRSDRAPDVCNMQVVMNAWITVTNNFPENIIAWAILVAHVGIKSS